MRQQAKALPYIKTKKFGSDFLFRIINATSLLLVSLLILYPLLHVLSASLSSGQAVTSGLVRLLPVAFNLTAYQKVVQYQPIWVGFANTLFCTVVGTLVNVVMTLIAAYPLSRRDLPARNLLLTLFLFSMVFNGGIIPTFLLVKQVGLYNTRWALIIPQALSVWNLLIAVTFFQTSIPSELYEAAQLDGTGDFRYFFRIALPLSQPLIAVLALYYAVRHWNQVFDALLYLAKPNLYPLQLILRQLLIQNQVDLTMMGDVGEVAKIQEMQTLIRYAAIVVASIPMLILYPFVQKHFVKGITLGAVKG